MKSYQQFCGIAKALDVVGQRWTMLILRELLLGPRRYSELQRSLHGITTNLLAKRMRELEAEGLVERVRRDIDDRRAWALTPAGERVRPALLELGRFGAQWMTAPDGDVTSDRWFVVSLQRRYAGGMKPTTVALRLGENWYGLEIDERALRSSDGRPETPQLTVEGPVPAVLAALSGRGADGVEVSDPVRFRELIETITPQSVDSGTRSTS